MKYTANTFLIEQLRRYGGRPVRRLVGPWPERPAQDGPHDWLFVVAADAKGWILDAICREIGSRQRGSWTVAYGNKIELPPAKTYFFSHYVLYLDHLLRNPHISKGNRLIWYTHPRPVAYSIPQQIEAYNQATQLFFACSQFRQAMIDAGLRPERGRVVLGAADPFLFPAHRRGSGIVGLSSAFYERKSPDTLLDLVRLLPHRKFRLLGRGWEKYERFGELTAAQNFQYVTAPYSDYPRHYRDIDVFVSLATLEGGPIPLIETMMANAVPVASRTGFAPDIVRHGENGFLFDVAAPPELIAPLIERAFALKTNVRATVRRYTWDAYARQIHALVC